MKRLPSFKDAPFGRSNNLASLPLGLEDERLLAAHLKTPDALETYEKLIIGMQIKKWRQRARFTQKELAKKLKTTQSVIARIEAGKQNLSIRVLVHIAVALSRKLHIKFL